MPERNVSDSIITATGGCGIVFWSLIIIWNGWLCWNLLTTGHEDGEGAKKENEDVTGQFLQAVHNVCRFFLMLFLGGQSILNEVCYFIPPPIDCMRRFVQSLLGFTYVIAIGYLADAWVAKSGEASSKLGLLLCIGAAFLFALIRLGAVINRTGGEATAMAKMVGPAGADASKPLVPKPAPAPAPSADASADSGGIEMTDQSASASPFGGGGGGDIPMWTPTDP